MSCVSDMNAAIAGAVAAAECPTGLSFALSRRLPTHLLVIDLRALLSVAVSATLPPTMTLQW